MRKAIAQASDTGDMFLRLEACGWMLLISRDEMATMFHHAVSSEAKVAVMQRITAVIRRSRVVGLEPDRMVMKQGTRATAPGTLFIDCTGTAVQCGANCWGGSQWEREGGSNAHTCPISFPETIEGSVGAALVNIGNQASWTANPAAEAWI